MNYIYLQDTNYFYNFFCFLVGLKLAKYLLIIIYSTDIGTEISHRNSLKIKINFFPKCAKFKSHQSVEGSSRRWIKTHLNISLNRVKISMVQKLQESVSLNHANLTWFEFNMLQAGELMMVPFNPKSHPNHPLNF
jgi:hypothetical protein